MSKIREIESSEDLKWIFQSSNLESLLPLIGFGQSRKKGMRHFAKIKLQVEKNRQPKTQISWEVKDNQVPKEFYSWVEKVIQQVTNKNSYLKFRVIDGEYYDVDSDSLGYEIATYKALIDCFY